MVFAQKPTKLKAAMADILENADADLTPLMRNLIDTLWGEWKTVEQQIEELNDELERISAADPGCTRIRKIPGIGPVVATAIVAAIGNGAAFRKGREFAAWLSPYLFRGQRGRRLTGYSAPDKCFPRERHLCPPLPGLRRKFRHSLRILKI